LYIKYNKKMDEYWLIKGIMVLSLIIIRLFFGKSSRKYESK